MTQSENSRNLVNFNFHEASWNEPLILEQSHPGQRGIVPPGIEKEMLEKAGSEEGIPAALRRKQPPRLPELAQPLVLRHYTRLSQMVLGNNVANNLGLATATMKYSPSVHELLVKLPELAEMHPEQDGDSVQGILEIYFRCAELLQKISGMHRFSFQPGGGAAALFGNALIVRAYHEARGEGRQRDEVITTIHSHPANAAAAATAGFKVVYLYPGPRGYPEIEALRTAVSERTAALMTTNPEDIGLYIPEIQEWVEVVHGAGGLCVYDQANANGIVGITRARDAGFDLCHFNLHKTFSIPHGSYGGGCGAMGVTSELEKFLPAPTVEFDGQRYFADYDRPDSIGKIRTFFGNAQAVLKAYCWIMSHGEEGLRQVAHTAVLNNNYLAERIRRIRGASVSFDEQNSDPRIEQIRCSWGKLNEETGIDTEDIRARIIDFGLQTYWTSHHPYTIPQPFSLEPTESLSKEDLDEFCQVLEQIVDEAYSDPEKIRTAPHRSTGLRPRADAFEDPPITWRGLQRRQQRNRE